MKCLVVKLKPKSSFHLGEREGWREGSKPYLPADTIFSALCHCHQLLYGEVDSLLDGFLRREPPFLLSSAFPLWQEELYFPMPKFKFLSPEETDRWVKLLKASNQEKKKEISLKDLKKIQFVNLSALRELLHGLSLFDFILKAAEDHTLKTIPVLFSQIEEKTGQVIYQWQKKPWTVDNVPRIALNRFSNHPGENFFNFGRVYYSPDAALFCLLKINQPQWETKIKALFYLLADEGIGGDRTCGLGLFNKPEYNEIDLPEVENGQWLYCLSPYFPADDELTGLAHGFYELEERRGYIFSPYSRSLRRRSIRIFTEGSVFPRNFPRKGKLVDITPDIFKKHKVYRYAYLFALPCIMEARKNEDKN